MSELMQSGDFKSIVLKATPLIDVRAPVEFEKGSFPNAINMPLMNDKERHEVGICYKKYGNDEALKLGHKLVSGSVKEKRVKVWLEFMELNAEAKLFCFRGGQRSKISQEWISQAGSKIIRFQGGYKAFRTYLMDEIEESPSHFKPIILGGHTGSGKTILLKELANSIDLEGLANHRGSSFGKKVTPQPTQINFENSLAYDLIQKLDKGFEHLIFEDEGNRVGNVFIPKGFAGYLSGSPLIILQTPMAERVKITFNEYVLEAQKMYDNNLVEYKEQTLDAINRIKKRLGFQRHQEVCDLFENAFEEQINNGSLDAHKEWVEYLLREYYDPMYDYQIEKRSQQVVFRGSSEEVVEYLSQLS